MKVSDILDIINYVTTLAGIGIAYLTYRAATKPPETAFTPTCIDILGANMGADLPNLPDYSRQMRYFGIPLRYSGDTILIR